MTQQPRPPRPVPPSQGTVLVDPAAMAAIRAAAQRTQPQRRRRNVRPFRVVSRLGGPRYAMVDPTLNGRHRRAARLVSAPADPRVALTQIVLPVLLLTALGWAAGEGLARWFDNPFVGRGIMVGMLTGLTALVGVALVAAQWQQGTGLTRHVKVVTGDHARAMVDIEEAFRVARKAHPRLPVVETLWTTMFDEAMALRTARSLEILPDDEDARVLEHLSRGPEVDLGPGNVTMLQSLVELGDPDD